MVSWIGRAHYDAGQIDKAREVLREAVALDPSQADAWFYLGYAENERGGGAAALAAFQKAARLDEANADAWFFFGEAAVAQRQRKLARQALERYLGLSPEGEQADEARAMLQRL